MNKEDTRDLEAITTLTDSEQIAEINRFIKEDPKGYAIWQIGINPVEAIVSQDHARIVAELEKKKRIDDGFRSVYEEEWIYQEKLEMFNLAIDEAIAVVKGEK